jgi:hypothetical protein
MASLGESATFVDDLTRQIRSSTAYQQIVPRPARSIKSGTALSDAIISALQAVRDQGWERHDTLSVQAVGTVMAELAKNSFADGSQFYVAGILRFDEHGKIGYVAAADENPSIAS